MKNVKGSKGGVSLVKMRICFPTNLIIMFSCSFEINNNKINNFGYFIFSILCSLGFLSSCLYYSMFSNLYIEN